MSLLRVTPEQFDKLQERIKKQCAVRKVGEGGETTVVHTPRIKGGKAMSSHDRGYLGGKASQKAAPLTSERASAMASLQKGKPKPGARKYLNDPVTLNGRKFDSKKEAERARQLALLVQAGEIFDLRYQVKYRLEVNGAVICDYFADFIYETKDGGLVVEDVKGYRGGGAYRVFRLKQKLMKAIHNVDVVEV